MKNSNKTISNNNKHVMNRSKLYYILKLRISFIQKAIKHKITQLKFKIITASILYNFILNYGL